MEEYAFRRAVQIFGEDGKSIGAAEVTAVFPRPGELWLKFEDLDTVKIVRFDQETYADLHFVCEEAWPKGFSVVYVDANINKVERVFMVGIESKEQADKIAARLRTLGVTRAWTTPTGVNDNDVPGVRLRIGLV